MALSRWFTLIGVLVAFGLAQVAWRHMLMMRSYEVGARVEQLERSRIDIARLTSQVEALESPTYLAKVSEERKLDLVAWKPMPSLTSDDLIRHETE